MQTRVEPSTSLPLIPAPAALPVLSLSASFSLCVSHLFPVSAASSSAEAATRLPPATPLQSSAGECGTQRGSAPTLDETISLPRSRVVMSQPLHGTRGTSGCAGGQRVRRQAADTGRHRRLLSQRQIAGSWEEEDRFGPRALLDVYCCCYCCYCCRGERGKN